MRFGVLPGTKAIYLWCLLSYPISVLLVVTHLRIVDMITAVWLNYQTTELFSKEVNTSLVALNSFAIPVFRLNCLLPQTFAGTMKEQNQMDNFIRGHFH